MEFNNAPPEWENKGAEPGEDLKKQGFLAGYKPPAAYFNWFWNKTSACIKELQEKLKGITKSDVGLDKVDNKSLEEILTEVTMDKANAKDTSGLVGAAQENVKAQQLLDELANRVATKLVEKGMIANNLVTTNENMVLAAPMGKALQDQITEQNNNIDGKISGSLKKYSCTTKGWYRIAKFGPNSNIAIIQGASGNSVLFNFKSSYSSRANMSFWGLLNTSNQKSNITIIGSEITYSQITKIRHTIDENNKTAYIELYYNLDTYNPFTFELICPSAHIDGEWELLNTLEKTEETVENVSIYSVADLTIKERNIVTNSDITGTNVEITTETLFTPEKYNRAIKNNSMVFLNIAGVANINSTSTWTKIMTLPSVCAPLTDVFGCVILNGTSDVIPVYIASNGYVYISPPIVLSNKGIRGSLCYFIGK